MHDVNASQAANAFAPLTASAVLVNAVGLHARPSVKLTQCAKSFAAKIEFALAPDALDRCAEFGEGDAREGTAGSDAAFPRRGPRWQGSACCRACAGA